MISFSIFKWSLKPLLTNNMELICFLYILFPSIFHCDCSWGIWTNLIFSNLSQNKENPFCYCCCLVEIMSLTFSINLRTMKVSSLHSSQVINCLLSLDDKNCFFIFLLTSLTTFCTFLHLNTNRRLQNEFKTMDASTFFI